MEIVVHKQNMEVIENSEVRLLHSVFDKRRYDRKKRRFINQDSKAIQRRRVDEEIELEKMVNMYGEIEGGAAVNDYSS